MHEIFCPPHLFNSCANPLLSVVVLEYRSRATKLSVLIVTRAHENSDILGFFNVDSSDMQA